MLIQQLRNLEMTAKQCCSQRAHKPTTPSMYMLRMFDCEVLCKVIESIQRGIVKGRSTRHADVRQLTPTRPFINTVQPETCCMMWFVPIKEKLHCVLHA